MKDKNLGSCNPENAHENLNENFNHLTMNKKSINSQETVGALMTGAQSSKKMSKDEQEFLQQLTYGGFAEFELTPDQRRLAREWAKQKLVERHKCSITKAYYYGFGHNAAPFEGRCCNYANSQFVIPARMELLQQGKEW